MMSYVIPLTLDVVSLVGGIKPFWSMNDIQLSTMKLNEVVNFNSRMQRDERMQRLVKTRSPLASGLKGFQIFRINKSGACSKARH